jgi:hypothetical protein
MAPELRTRLGIDQVDRMPDCCPSTNPSGNNARTFNSPIAADLLYLVETDCYER